MKRTGILLPADLAGGVVASLGDHVWVDRLSYRNVTVVDVREGKIMGGRRLEKPLAEATRVRLKDHPSLSRAEELLDEGRAEEAIAAYEQPLAGVWPGKVRVTVELAREHAPVLARFSKGDRVVVSGIIVLHTAEEGKHRLVGPDGSLKLQGRGVVTEGAKSR